MHFFSSVVTGALLIPIFGIVCCVESLKLQPLVTGQKFRASENSMSLTFSVFKLLPKSFTLYFSFSVGEIVHSPAYNQ